jgi:hypothetical protein
MRLRKLRPHNLAGMALALLAAALTTGIRAPQSADAALPRWTVMVYMAGENTLGAQVEPDIQEMELAGSTADVNIVVMADLPPALTINSMNNFRGLVSHHPAGGIGSSFTALAAEPNTGDPATLRDFVTWATGQYPALNHALIVWGHGDGWRGVAPDANGGSPDSLTMDEFPGAFGPKHLGLLAFDACLMAQLEVALQLTSEARLLVASQDCIQGAGFPYDTMLNALKTNPEWDAQSLADDMVDRHSTEYASDPDHTLSAVRLNNDLHDLADLVGALGALLATGAEDHNGVGTSTDNVSTAVRLARNDTVETTEGCCRHTLTTDDAVDIVSLADELDAEADIDAAYKAPIPQIKAKLADVVIDSKTGSTYANGKANGLSLFFPQRENSGIGYPFAIGHFDEPSASGSLYSANPEWDAVDNKPVPFEHPYPSEKFFVFPLLHKWDEFLFRFYRPVADAGPSFSIPVGATVTLNGAGSADTDGTIATYAWDFAPRVSTDADDSDRDGIDGTADDVDAGVVAPQFTCTVPGIYPIRLVVRDNHSTVHNDHFNVDDDQTSVECTPSTTTTSITTTTLTTTTLPPATTTTSVTMPTTTTSIGTTTTSIPAVPISDWGSAAVALLIVIPGSFLLLRRPQDGRDPPGSPEA